MTSRVLGDRNRIEGGSVSTRSAPRMVGWRPSYVKVCTGAAKCGLAVMRPATSLPNLLRSHALGEAATPLGEVAPAFRRRSW